MFVLTSFPSDVIYEVLGVPLRQQRRRRRAGTKARIRRYAVLLLSLAECQGTGEEGGVIYIRHFSAFWLLRSSDRWQLLPPAR